MAVVKEGMSAKQSATPLQTTNAVTPADIEAPEHVFDGVQPRAVVLQRTLGAATDGNEPDVAALERCELHVSSGSQVAPQWKPLYLSGTFCDFPRGSCGPEFNNVARLRVTGAPEVPIAPLQEAYLVA